MHSCFTPKISDLTLTPRGPMLRDAHSMWKREPSCVGRPMSQLSASRILAAANSLSAGVVLMIGLHASENLVADDRNSTGPMIAASNISNNRPMAQFSFVETAFLERFEIGRAHV